MIRENISFIPVSISKNSLNSLNSLKNYIDMRIEKGFKQIDRTYIHIYIYTHSNTNIHVHPCISTTNRAQDLWHFRIYPTQICSSFTSNTHWERFRKILKLILQRPNMSFTNVSITNYVDEITRGKTCTCKLMQKDS